MADINIGVDTSAIDKAFGDLEAKADAFAAKVSKTRTKLEILQRSGLTMLRRTLTLLGITQQYQVVEDIISMAQTVVYERRAIMTALAAKTPLESALYWGLAVSYGLLKVQQENLKQERSINKKRLEDSRNFVSGWS